MPVITAALCFFVIITGVNITMLCWYIFQTPTPRDPPVAPSRLNSTIGVCVHVLAYACALLRLPFALLPWLIKWCLFHSRTQAADHIWHSNAAQAARMLGEGINLYLTASFLLKLHIYTPEHIPLALIIISAAAEVLRLIAQRGQMIMSAVWQWLPHRAFAATLRTRGVGAQSGAQRYCDYYELSDDERLCYVLAALRARAAADALVQRRLQHLHGFRIVPNTHYLRSGYVRDVARGEVFVHRRWTNDPWLLIGQALRRAPWMFDPRELPRPFVYRTQANRVVTAFVLHCWRYSPPYAWYQFGHETKAAAHEIVLRMLHVGGWGCEMTLRADGVFAFGGEHGDHALCEMWSDDQVIADLLQRATPAPLNALQIAERYTYPQAYVADVLLPRLVVAQQQPTFQEEKAFMTAAAVSAGASQCG